MGALDRSRWHDGRGLASGRPADRPQVEVTLSTRSRGEGHGQWVLRIRHWVRMRHDE
jgi:hypothetical protein